MTAEHPQVVSTDNATYDYVFIPPTNTLPLKLRDLFGLGEERSPDLDWYGLTPPVLVTVLPDSTFVHSAQPAPVPRRSLAFRSPHVGREFKRCVCATFTRAGSYLPLDTLAGGSISYDQNRNLLSFEMVPLWLAPSLRQLPT